MIEFPEQVEHQGQRWTLDSFEGKPIDVCAEGEPPHCAEDMTALEVAGHIFGPSKKFAHGPGLCYSLPTPRLLRHAQKLRSVRLRIRSCYRAQEHLLKLLEESDDEEEIMALTEAFFLAERDRNANRGHEKRERTALLATFEKMRNLNAGRTDDNLISDDEQEFFLYARDARLDDVCAKRPDLAEKRNAVVEHDRQRQQRRSRAFAFLDEAGLRNGIAILGPLDEEMQRSKAATSGPVKRRTSTRF